MKIVFDKDFPVAIGTHGIETDILFDHARLVGGDIVDVSQCTHFFIDKGGRKHAVDLGGNQSLNCRLDDELILEKGIWRIKTPIDFYHEQHNEVDKRRQIEYTSRVRPYLEESEIKKYMGDSSEYTRLMNQAVKERKKIQAENPFPDKPAI